MLGVTYHMNNKAIIKLRAMEPEDIDNIYDWENDPTTWICSAAHQPFSRHALQQFINDCASADIYSCRQLRLMGVDNDGVAVGCVDLFDFDPYHQRAGVGIIVDSSKRRKGFGLEMLLELQLFASQHLNLHQLHCTIAADNTPSIALFSKAGFSPCGTLKQWNLDSSNHWCDALIYQKIIRQ